MPGTRVLILAIVVVAVGCRFEADYDDGSFRCSDQVCPAGLSCVDGTCVTPGAIDAAVIDAEPTDATPPDASASLTCVDPGLIDRGIEVVFAGTTAGGSNHVSASCATLVMNGLDDIYRVTAVAGDDLDVGVEGDAQIRALVMAPCEAAPATPACVGNMLARPANPIALTNLTAGDHFVIVDSENAALEASYTLTVHLRP